MRSTVLCQYSWFLVFGFRGCCFLFCYGFNGPFFKFHHPPSEYIQKRCLTCLSWLQVYFESLGWLKKLAQLQKVILKLILVAHSRHLPFVDFPDHAIILVPQRKWDPENFREILQVGEMPLFHLKPRYTLVQINAWNQPWKERKMIMIYQTSREFVCHVNVQRCIYVTDIPESSKVLKKIAQKKNTKNKPGGPHHSTCKTQPATQTLQDPTLGLHLKLGHQAEGGWIDEWRVSEDMKIFLGPVKVGLLGWLVSVGLDYIVLCVVWVCCDCCNLKGVSSKNVLVHWKSQCNRNQTRNYVCCMLYAYWFHTHDADDHQYHMLHITFIA